PTLAAARSWTGARCRTPARAARPGRGALPFGLARRIRAWPAPESDGAGDSGMIDVVMPQLGESVAEGTVTKWLVREGDVVARQQPIAVVSTDKADTEVTSTAAGRVAKLL